MTETIEIEPIDTQRCQCEELGGSFMTFGPRPWIRCKNIPTWIAFDIRDGSFYGAMSVCGKCKEIAKKMVPTASFVKLKASSMNVSLAEKGSEEKPSSSSREKEASEK